MIKPYYLSVNLFDTNYSITGTACLPYSTCDLFFTLAKSLDILLMQQGKYIEYSHRLLS